MKDLEKYNIILASQSPRRQELMRNMGFKITVKTSQVEESYPENLKREAIPVYLSQLKAEALKSDLNDKEILITADTIVWKDERILHKPKDKDSAVKMLQDLSNGMHHVYTGVSIIHPKKELIFSDCSKVQFSPLDKDEIDFYIEHYKPFDKAGGYGIQEWIGYIGIHRIEGSYYNIMGLPTHLVYKGIKDLIQEIEKTN